LTGLARDTIELIILLLYGILGLVLEKGLEFVLLKKFSRRGINLMNINYFYGGKIC